MPRRHQVMPAAQHKFDTFVTGGQTGADSIPFTVHDELDVKLVGYMPVREKTDCAIGIFC